MTLERCWSLKPRTSNLCTSVLRTTVCQKTIATEILTFYVQLFEPITKQLLNLTGDLGCEWLKQLQKRSTFLQYWLAFWQTVERKSRKLEIFDFNVWILKFLLFCLGSITNTMKRSYGSDTFKTSNSFLHDTSKGGLISESFSFWLKSSQKYAKSLFCTYLFGVDSAQDSVGTFLGEI